jgi:hypothetical protein
VVNVWASRGITVKRPRRRGKGRPRPRSHAHALPTRNAQDLTAFALRLHVADKVNMMDYVYQHLFICNDLHKRICNS